MNSELICHNHPRILVKYVDKEDLQTAIKNAYLKKIRMKGSEKYTAVRLRNGRSFAFNKIPPEVAINCIIQESFVGFAEGSYIRR